MIIEIKQFSRSIKKPRLNVYILSVKMMVNFIEYPHKIKEESVLR